MSTCRCSDCCTGISVQTPVEVFDPPALGAVAHRVGTHSEFLATMLAQLSSPAYPALGSLTVRTVDDPAIGLLDASALLADLLTFYTERIANEGYLRTATEEGSLALLGRLVGHTPRPGVAAGTYLSYTVDADPRPGRDLEARVPRGSRAQSVPGPGEEPQAFESMEDLVARHSWNDLKVRRSRPYQLTKESLVKRQLTQVKGVATNLRPGDRLLYVFGSEAGRQQLEIVSSIDVDRDRNVTAIGKPAPALDDLKTLRTELRDDLDALFATPPDVVRRSVILQRLVDSELRPLRAAAGKNEDPPKPEDPGDLKTPTLFADRIAEVTERLDEALVLAEHYTHVKTWLAEWRAKLAGWHEKARQLEPPQPGEPSLYEALAIGTPSPKPTSPAVLGLGVLLGALRTPPSRSPAGSRQLRRDVSKLYAPGSDLAAQLLAALDPRIEDGLYTAWRQVDLTAPLALRELLAMRQVATPFGATAPLRAIPNQNSVEWDLEAPQTFGVTVFYGTSPDPTNTPATARLLFELDANAWRDEIADLSENGRLDFGPGSVDYTVTAEKVTFAAKDKLPRYTVSVSTIDGGEVEVTVKGDWADIDPITLPTPPTDPPPNTDPDELWRFVSVTDTKTNRPVYIRLRRVKPENTVQPEFVEVSLSTSARIPSNVLTLDAVYEGVGIGSWVVVERPRKGTQIPSAPNSDLALVTARVRGVRIVAKQAFGISGKVTELVLDRPWLDERDTRLSQLRDTTIYLRGDSLALADEPITEDVAEDTIELAELYDGLAPGRWVIITGERTDIPGKPTGVPGTELAMIAGVRQDVAKERPGETVHSTIVLATPLAFRYRRETVHVYGNVVRATQGAGRDEPIGSGDEGKANQTFLLRQGPLTWLAADNPLGAQSTLEIRVDGIRWHEVDSFAGRGGAERVYVTQPGEGDSLRVIFGDGVRGARLPTGVENVRARYRVGLGKSGNIAAGRITQLTTRPLGVSGVNNHLPANGGANRDDASLLRRNIPLRVTAFDRLVSVPDHEDFARARAGIGRASARRLSNGSRQVVHLTVAGVDDIALQDDSDIVTTLRASLAAHGDTGLPVEVAVRESVLLVISANIRVHPDHEWETVEPAVRAALLDRLGFRNRELGQPAYLSEVLATAQAVPGVDHVDADVFAGVAGSITPVQLDELAESLSEPHTVVPARFATFDETRYRVRPPHETLTAVAAKHGITVGELLRLNPDIRTADRLEAGRSVVVFRGVRPAQLALLSPAVPDTLILKEVRP